MATGLFNANLSFESRTTNKTGGLSFAGMITRLMPNGQAPLFGMTSMLKDETATQVEHGFYSKTMLFPSATINAAGGYAAGVTTFVVASSANLLPGMILQSAANENILVLTVPNATSITVQRGVGVVAATAIADAEVLYQVGNAHEEGSTRPTALRIDAVRVTNLTQIFRNAWSLTGTVQATGVLVGDSHISENRQDCAGFHAADIEKALFFGQKGETTLNGQPLRFMDGIISIVTQNAPTNVTAAGATTDFTQLEAALDPVFDQTTDPKGANERVLFVGSKAHSVINNIGRLNGTYQLVDGQSSWGLQFKTFKTTRGTFQVIEHPLFNSNPLWSAMAVAVDLPTFSLAYLSGRKTLNKEYNAEGNQAADNATDASFGVLTTECTAVVKNASANAVITGLTAAAAG